MSTDDDVKKKGLSDDEIAYDAEDLVAMFKLILAKLDAIDALDAKIANIGRRVNNHQEVLECLEFSRENHHDRTFAHFNCNTKVRGMPKLQKPDFPIYDGQGDPLSFIHHYEKFFRGYHVLEEEKVWMASIHLLDATNIW
jgi:hypothetical protein